MVYIIYRTFSISSSVDKAKDTYYGLFTVSAGGDPDRCRGIFEKFEGEDEEIPIEISFGYVYCSLYTRHKLFCFDFKQTDILFIKRE